jgi:hypothetical protein
VNLAALAGLRTVPTLTAGRVPTMLNSRVVLRSADDRKGQVPFTIRSYARLVPIADVAKTPDALRVALTYGRNIASARRAAVDQAIHDMFRRLAVTLPSGDRGTSRAPGTRHDLVSARDGYVDQVIHCCGMPTCPVEAVQTSVESMSWTVGTERVQTHEDQADRLRLIAARFATTSQPARKTIRTSNRDSSASITLDCFGGENPGTFALALNRLLLNTLELDKTDGLQLNLKYVSAYECHDLRFGVFSCYGVLEDDQPATVVPTVERVVVKPVTDRPSWQTYMAMLKKHLEDVEQRRFSLDSTSPYEISLTALS